MLSTKLNTKLTEIGLDPKNVEKVVTAAIAEDLAGGSDVTSKSTIPENQDSIAEFVARKPGIVAGLNVAAAVLESEGITEYEILVSEGSHINAG